MGFANSTCSFSRFRILDPVPAELWPQIPDKLKQFAFRDIDDIPEMQSQGWTSFEDMLDTDWAEAPPQKGAYLVFSLRLDSRRIPAGVVKKHLALALRQEKERMREQNKTFISRERKKELKEQVLLRLRQRFSRCRASSMCCGPLIKMKSGLLPPRGKCLICFWRNF